MGVREDALDLHEKHRGKIEINCKSDCDTKDDLSLLYTPGVAAPCEEILEARENVYKYTNKGNTVAIVTDGTAVLGLGDIGTEASLPVMEGKSILFKEFADVDAYPILLDSKDVDEIVRTVKNIAPTFSGINLEDISSPRCFEIEDRLKEELDIPVFHDDQHGAAIVIAAGLLNSLRLAGKRLEEARIVICGAGASGIATAEFLLALGAENIILCDSKGVIWEGRDKLNHAKEEIAKVTNKAKDKGSVQEVMEGAEVFIGVSAPNLIGRKDVERMSDDPIVFALANPDPEIPPLEAKEGGAFIVATGRSDYPNQVNNSLVFPGLFRGLLDCGAKDITLEMKVAVAETIADHVPEEELAVNRILPDTTDKTLTEAIAQSVKESCD